jgi:hypothetical protein
MLQSKIGILVALALLAAGGLLSAWFLSVRRSVGNGKEVLSTRGTNESASSSATPLSQVPQAIDEIPTDSARTEPVPDLELTGAPTTPRAGATVRGRVVDPRGIALEGAAVTGLVEGDKFTATDRTRADGSFEIRGIVPDRVFLYVGAAGMRNANVDLGAMNHGEIREGVEIRLEAQPPITGFVQWSNGTPAAGCVVTVSHELNSDFIRQEHDVICDRNGRFRFVDSGDEPASLTAIPPADADATRAPGQSGTTWMAHRDDIGQGTSDLILTLTPASEVHGTIRDDAGVVPGGCTAYAVAYCRDHSFRTRNRSVAGIVDADSGKFVIQGLHEGVWQVVADAPGCERTGFWIEDPREAEPLEITLPRTVHLLGIVVDTSEKPVAEADVFFVVRSTDGRSGEPWERILGPRRTDEEGRFELDRVPPGHHAIEAYSKDRTLCIGSDVNVVSGTTPSEVRLVLRPTDQMLEEERPPRSTRSRSSLRR